MNTSAKVRISEHKTKEKTRKCFILFGGVGDFLEITGSVLLIIFYVENLDVGSWGVK